MAIKNIARLKQTYKCSEYSNIVKVLHTGASGFDLLRQVDEDDNGQTRGRGNGKAFTRGQGIGS